MVRLASAGLVVAATAIAIGWDGGFSGASQWTFAAVAVGAAALARGRVSPVVVALAAVAACSALSAAWTIGPPADALRAGALAAGYAALAVAARGIRPRAEHIGAALAVAAAVTAALGLAAAARFSDSFAEWLQGGWRPEGPFGYAPALA